MVALLVGLLQMLIEVWWAVVDWLCQTLVPLVVILYLEKVLSFRFPQFPEAGGHCPLLDRNRFQWHRHLRTHLQRDLRSSSL